MKFIEPCFEIISEDFTREVVLDRIERAARTCYKSEDKITEGSAERLVKALIKNGHEAMIEHAPNLSVRVITCRGVTHEIVRHRLFSFAQESTRYVKYGKDDEDMEFLLPPWIPDSYRDVMLSHEKLKSFSCALSDVVGTSTEMDILSAFISSLKCAEVSYTNLITLGWKPQQAREVLPNAVKSEIVITGNVREWRNFFKLRLDPAAHPQMREWAIPLFKKLNTDIPEIWGDIADKFNIQ